MKRLYRKIYLTILGSLVLVVVLAGLVWQFGGQRPPMSEALSLAGELMAAALPPADAPPAAQQQTLEHLAGRLGTDLTLFDSELQLVASSAAPLRAPSGEADSGWSYGHGGPMWTVPLPDGRWLVARVKDFRRNPLLTLILLLTVVALAVGVSAYPVARGLTRRLERLQAGVETLGAGDLAARVEVEGRDEVAGLAASFNRAAARIDELVGAHRMLLANASHELRTPLSRIRLGIDLLERNSDPGLKAALGADIAELDRLIDEILLASRLDATPALGPVEAVELQALVAEECARYEDVELESDGVVVEGDARLLRRLVRNLLENAARHGRPPVHVAVRGVPGGALLRSRTPARVSRRRIATASSRRSTASPATIRAPASALSLVRQIARLHGGDAVVAEDPVSGRPGFEIRLPRQA